ncbi:MAG: PilZ domain-containing protein [Proteobacteria bacterium]|nr:PilZ domain-containing protein [Pseudomonadota bacterium]
MQSFDVLEKRNRARIEARIRIQLVGVDEYERNYTGNVSKDGVFLETDEASLKIGEKVEMLIYVDEDDDEPLRVIGKVVRFEKANQIGKPQGVGIDFLKIESRRARTFDKFLEKLFDTKGLGCRKYPRAEVQVTVEIKNAAQAKQALTFNLSKGGAFLRTPVQGFVLGDTLQVVRVQPTTNRKFVLQAQVVHIREGSSSELDEFQEGLGVQFTDLSDLRNQDLTLFLKAIFSSKKRKKSDSDEN